MIKIFFPLKIISKVKMKTKIIKYQMLFNSNLQGQISKFCRMITVT